jgi:NAD(P)-dependent dehydrogenase (short-subunit alcohol dehydrogenase family)
MKNVLVTGANRGLGLGFVKNYLEKNINVVSTTRELKSSKELLALKEKFPNNLEIFELDLLKEGAGYALANFLGDRPIDILINNAGVGSTNQHLQAVSPKPWLEVLKVNLIAPLMVTQSIIDNVKKGSDKKIYFLSSQLGSIADNTSGGMYIYRSSKTGLNQVVKSLSVDLKPQGITVVSLHPGWVKTDMGGPNAPVSIDESIEGMMQVIYSTDIRDTGRFLNYDGKELPW